MYGSVFGTVTDRTGALLPNATVTVTDVSKGISVATQTNASGQYRVDHLIPDTYSIQVSAPGFESLTTSNVIVYADTSPKVDVKLQVGYTTNSVEAAGKLATQLGIPIGRNSTHALIDAPGLLA